jgi:hypothetical protein
MPVLAMIIHIGAMRGTIGVNHFGPDPAEGEHADDHFSRARFINLIGSPWMPIYTVLGRTWVGVRQVMEKLGACRIARAMKRAEERHERGVQRNLKLAEQYRWNRVLYWHGRSVPDPRIHSPTRLSIIAEVITAIVVVGVVVCLTIAAPLLMLDMLGLDVDVMLKRFTESELFVPISIFTVAPMSVATAVWLVLWRTKKARTAKAEFLAMGSDQTSVRSTVTFKRVITDLAVGCATALVGVIVFISWSILLGMKDQHNIQGEGALTVWITIIGTLIVVGLNIWREKSSGRHRAG